MAIKELFSVVQSTVPVNDETQNIHAGMLVALNSSGQAVLAARGTTAGSGGATVTGFGFAQFLGLAADDAVRTGNTLIQADPVGSTKVAADGTITANNNAWFSATKRALGDYQDETVTNVTNLTAGSAGTQGPARGIGVYNYTPGTQFIVDHLAVSNHKASSGTADGAAAGTWAPGTMLTIGTYSAVAADNHSGTFVEVDSTSAATVDYGKPIARLDKIEGTQGATGTLYYITLV